MVDEDEPLTDAAKPRLRIVANGTHLSSADEGHTAPLHLGKGRPLGYKCEGMPWHSAPNAVISRTLAEHTRVALATLTPRERHVLQLRFGIVGAGDPGAAESDREFVLTRQEIELIEARVLRKLRHPGAFLRGVVRA